VVFDGPPALLAETDIARIYGAAQRPQAAQEEYA